MIAAMAFCIHVHNADAVCAGLPGGGLVTVSGVTRENIKPVLLCIRLGPSHTVADGLLYVQL